MMLLCLIFLINSVVGEIKLHAKEMENSESILQTSQEQKHIIDALDAPRKSKDAPPHVPEPEKKDRELYVLNAILYTNDTSWSVWVGSHVLNQNHSQLSDNVSVRAVNPRTVEVMDGESKVILFIGQSYDPKRKSVVMGG
ncbi:MAG: hypothetical protein K2X98_05200 [Alphaproteobacteria bacterium]|nr:hypothetical protein [Alphaproteobacteria bacterium]